MREIFKSGSVRGLIVTLGLLPQQKVRYGLYSTCARIFSMAIYLYNIMYKNPRRTTSPHATTLR
jgi:hypothetical protein